MKLLMQRFIADPGLIFGDLALTVRTSWRDRGALENSKGAKTYSLDP
jgi:hypothetical protein